MIDEGTQKQESEQRQAEEQQLDKKQLGQKQEEYIKKQMIEKETKNKGEKDMEADEITTQTGTFSHELKKLKNFSSDQKKMLSKL